MFIGEGFNPVGRRELSCPSPKRGGFVLLCLLSAVCGLLLFVGEPDDYWPRSVKAAWNLGHDVTFFFWTATSIRGSTAFARMHIGRQLTVTALATIALGFLIEWIQSVVGRSFSVADVARDLNGAMLGVVFLSPGGKDTPKSLLRLAQAALLILIMIQAYPTAASLVDQLIARRQFPVLSDLETPFERSRWKSGFPLSIDMQVVRQGRASLQVRLMPDKYARLSLVYFPEDWKGYSTLRFSVFNGSHNANILTCEIYDIEHIRDGKAYSDRFNQRFKLDAGWTDVIIPLEHVENAPKDRRMDLAHIKRLMLYIEDLQTPIVLNIDDVRLE